MLLFLLRWLTRRGREAGRGAPVQVRALEQWMIPNKLEQNDEIRRTISDSRVDTTSVAVALQHRG
ncbi:TPA: hypothetical protein ACHKPG_003439 [Escherichia coli]